MTEVFGKSPDGSDVHRIRLEGGGLTAHVLTWGALLQDLRLAGHAPALVLGFDSFAPYLTHSPYFGATAGRCANRIRDGRFTLDGRQHQLDRNFLGRHHLHGGSASMGKRLWTLDGADTSTAAFSIRLADGEMGYPGAMTARATYRLLPDGVLDIVFEAETDRTTLCNLAHHSYFNLVGAGTILDHELQVAADAYLPVDAELIPTGEERDVAETPFDFRSAKRIRKATSREPIDHNFCLSRARGELRPVGRLSSRKSGVAMEIRTTEPGLQVYDGAKIAIEPPGLDGRSMGANAGVAIEPQVWPDAIHHPAFPQAILHPGETYAQRTQFAFSRNAI